MNDVGSAPKCVEMAIDRGALCEPPDTVADLETSVAALRAEAVSTGPEVGAVLRRIGEALRLTAAGSPEWMTLASLAGQLNAPGAVTAH